MGISLAPYGGPFIYIYQAGAQRTLGLLLPFTAFKLHRITCTTLPTAKAGTAQTCHWHPWAIALVAKDTPRAALPSNGMHRGNDNGPVCGTVPLSGLIEAPQHSWTAEHAKGGAHARCMEHQWRTW